MDAKTIERVARGYPKFGINSVYLGIAQQAVCINVRAAAFHAAAHYGMTFGEMGFWYITPATSCTLLGC